ncbi:alpha/beta-hydrolase, partial [Choiromyces venosus 120613-1]
LHNPCKPITLLFARDTHRAGNIGTGVGPLFFNNLTHLLPFRVSLQGVNNYPASVCGYLEEILETGAQYMADLVLFDKMKCPDSKIVLPGYIQGAQVVHKAIDRLMGGDYARIAAVVLFRDPKFGKVLPGALGVDLFTVCHRGG